MYYIWPSGIVIRANGVDVRWRESRGMLAARSVAAMTAQWRLGHPARNSTLEDEGDGDKNPR